MRIAPVLGISADEKMIRYGGRVLHSGEDRRSTFSTVQGCWIGGKICGRRLKSMHDYHARTNRHLIQTHRSPWREIEPHSLVLLRLGRSVDEATGATAGLASL